MKSLKIHFDTLDGYYNLVVLDDRTYSIETTIESLDSKSGVIDDYDKFVKELSEVNIPSWDNDYNSNNLDIEDGVKWKVELDDYSSSGLEGNWPYTYDKLIDVIKLIDSKADYFKANVA